MWDKWAKLGVVIVMKDKKIAEKFEQYASEFPSQEGLTQKAHVAMKKTHRKPRVSRRAAGAFACVMIACIALAILCPVLIVENLDNSTPTTSTPGSSTPQFVQYERRDVKGKRCSASDVSIDMDEIKALFTIISEDYRAYYLDDELVYYTISFGILHDGGVSEVYLTIEMNGYVRKDLKNEYDRYMSNSAYFVNTKTSNGEYVTKAYLESNDAHCYLQVLGDKEIALPFAEFITGQIY